jgi:hypothetical protein
LQNFIAGEGWAFQARHSCVCGIGKQKKPVIPAYAGIQNRIGLLSLLKQNLALNRAVHGFRQNSVKGFDTGIRPE